MFFGATPFASTTFAGVGIQNITVLANGNRLNIAIGNTTVDLITKYNSRSNYYCKRYRTTN
jgi:hypothetical protein